MLVDNKKSKTIKKSSGWMEKKFIGWFTILKPAGVVENGTLNQKL